MNAFNPRMDQYIDQLIEDLGEVVQQVPPPGPIWNGVDQRNPNEAEDMAYLEQHLEGEPRPLSKILGIEQEVFPPIGRLTGAQADLLLTAMVNVLEEFHFVPDFPEGLPVSIKYEVLRTHWDQEYVAVTGGVVNMEFCAYDTGTCPFPKAFCGCLVVEQEVNEGNQRNVNEDDDIELPF